MAYFEYEAINPIHFPMVDRLRRDPRRLEQFIEHFSHSTQLVSGVVEADNPELAVAKLNRLNLVPVRLALIINGREGVQQLMRFKKKRDGLMGIKSTPNVALPTPRRHINYTQIIGIVGVLALLTLILLGIK